MSGLAEYYLNKGYTVTGSDTTESNITRRLKKLGAIVSIGHTAENVNNFLDTLVYSSAVGQDNPELLRAHELHIRILKRAEMLGEVVNDKFLIAVSGTHGKTTTTAMIGKALSDYGFDPLVFVGGNVQLFDGGASRFGSGNYAVVEADEYDRSFLTLKPDIAVITNIDEDHLDIYGNLENIKDAFKQFCTNSKKGARIIYFGDDINIKDMIESISREKYSYGFGNSNYFKIKEIGFERDVIKYSIYNSLGEYRDFTLKLLGKHNVLNSVACFAVCRLLKMDFEQIRESVKEFKTVDRRLQLKYENDNIKVYDDYAHHPKEIRASLEALKNIYRTSRIITVFQPHLYTRTKDFYAEFADELSIADMVILLEIYPAREEAIQGVTSKMIYEELVKESTKAEYVTNNNVLTDYLLSILKPNDIVIFQGAGDITKLCDEFIIKLTNKKS